MSTESLSQALAPRHLFINVNIAYKYLTDAVNVHNEL